METKDEGLRRGQQVVVVSRRGDWTYKHTGLVSAVNGNAVEVQEFIPVEGAGMIVSTIGCDRKPDLRCGGRPVVTSWSDGFVFESDEDADRYAADFGVECVDHRIVRTGVRMTGMHVRGR